jgi:hypothetical protein
MPRYNTKLQATTKGREVTSRKRWHVKVVPQQLLLRSTVVADSSSNPSDCGVKTSKWDGSNDDMGWGNTGMGEIGMGEIGMGEIGMDETDSHWFGCCVFARNNQFVKAI